MCVGEQDVGRLAVCLRGVRINSLEGDTPPPYLKLAFSPGLRHELSCVVVFSCLSVYF